MNENLMENGKSTTVTRGRMYMAAFAANLIYISTGCVMAWPSPTITTLGQKITKDEGSWMGALFGLGAAIGPVMTGFLIDPVGRKKTLYITMSVFLMSWIIIGATQNIYVIYVGRIIGGVGVGASFASASVYLVEISDIEFRGAIGSINQMFVGFGLLTEYCVGPYVSYEVLIIVSALMALLFGLAFYRMPESPYHLFNRGETEKAINSLSWLRGNVYPYVIQDEIELIQRNLAESNIPNGFKSDLFKFPAPRRALAICLFVMFGQQITGANAILAFTQQLFDMAKVPLKSTYSSMLVGVVNIISSACAPPIVRKFGLKFVLIGSGFGMGICQILTSIYLYLDERNYNVTSINVLPVITVVLFNVFFCIGIGPLPWTVVAEMFPAYLKGFASSFIGVFVWLLSFTVLKTYLDFMIAAGQFSVFLFFGITAIIAMVIICFILPNTKGMSLQDIQDLLNAKRNN